MNFSFFRGGPSHFFFGLGGVEINLRNLGKTRGGHGQFLQKRDFFKGGQTLIGLKNHDLGGVTLTIF